MSNFSDTVRMMYRSKGDALEAAIVSGLVRRGVDEYQARAAARTCSSRIWRNGTVSGAMTGVIVGAIGTPVAGGFAGASMFGVVGYSTFLQSDACREVRDLSDLDVQSSVDRLLRGF